MDARIYSYFYGSIDLPLALAIVLITYITILHDMRYIYIQ